MKAERRQQEKERINSGGERMEYAFGPSHVNPRSYRMHPFFSLQLPESYLPTDVSVCVTSHDALPCFPLLHYLADKHRHRSLCLLS